MSDDLKLGPVQYNRKCTLLISNRAGDALDLSDLRIKFSVKCSATMTPNMADIRVYNLEEKTALAIRQEFTQVTLEAGYEGNTGVIFQGNIRQVIIGRESGTDTFIDIIAGDGDKAYNFAVVKTTLAKGASQKDQIDTVVKAMAPKGVTAGFIAEQPSNKLPRGKVMFGNARDYARDVAQTSNNTWFIQNEKVTFVEKKAYLPGVRVVLNSQTGMIGTPQQTNDGVNIKSLLNPNLRIAARVQIDNKTIAVQKLNLEQIALAKGDTKTINQLTPRRLQADGIYYLLVIEHTGDTRGVDWYSNMICLSIDQSANPRNSVQSG